MPETDFKLNETEDALKKKYLDIINQLSYTELRNFKKMEYKKLVLSEMRTLFPEYQKNHYDQTALCVANFLQSEVQTRLRKISADQSFTTETSLLSESVIQALDLTLQPDDDMSGTENSIGEQLELDTCGNQSYPDSNNSTNHDESSSNLNDSITKLKEIASVESRGSKHMNGNKESDNHAKAKQCCDSCKVKTSSKKKYGMIQCTFCMQWFHEYCVGIQKDDPIGIWVCLTCRKVPVDLKQDIKCLKHEVDIIKQCTQSIFKAIEGLSTKFDQSLKSVNDRLTSVSTQINSEELCITESVLSLQSLTENLKTSVDQKSSQILNKTTAVFDKVKAHTETLNKIKNNQFPQQHNDQNKSNTIPNKPDNSSSRSMVNTNSKNGKQLRKPKETTQVPNTRPTIRRGKQSKPILSSNPTSTIPTGEVIDTIDLTTKPKKSIQTSTLLVGSSIVKGIRTSYLKPNVAVRTFPGATVDSLRTKLGDYDLDKCTTIILHVGGNDASNSTDLDAFCDFYISLLDSLLAEDRRLIVSGLLPRGNVDIEPYNDKLKSLCDEIDLEFIDHFDSFSLATGEIAETYFYSDKTHLNASGTRKFLANIDTVCKVAKLANLLNNNAQISPPKKYFQSSRRGTRPPPR